jgi:Nitrile hydratase beta subunit
MNGQHDLCGMQSFGPVPRENEPVFDATWEGRVEAMTMVLLVAGHFGGGGVLRYAIESLPPVRYLQDGYFERHLDGLEGALVRRCSYTRPRSGIASSKSPAALFQRRSPVARWRTRAARPDPRNRAVNPVIAARLAGRHDSSWAIASPPASPAFPGYGSTPAALCRPVPALRPNRRRR